MAATIEIKYFNSFWVKKVNSKDYQSSTSSEGVQSTVKSNPNFTGLPFYSYGTTDANRYLNYFTVSDTTKTKPDINIVNTIGDWFIEESRIKGSFNGSSTDYGVKAYVVDKNYISEIARNKIIYSGLFNSDTNVNETNVFSQATNITFVAPPEYGSIQKLYSSDTKLHIFQENKISRALLDKDAIYAANGQGTPVSTTKLVIGDITTYVGEFGISTNPESFDYYANRMYFTDKRRNSVIRLSNNGITEISDYGMKDYFRDKLSSLSENLKVVEVSDTIDTINPSWPYPNTLSPGEPYLSKNSPGGPVDFVEAPYGSAILINGVETGCFVEEVYSVNNLGEDWRVKISDLIPFQFAQGSVITFRNYEKDLITGSYDVYSGNYMLSLQGKDSYDTLSFDEKSNGWVSFFDYKPSFMYSLFSSFYSTTKSSLWVHHSDEAPRNSFYGSEPNKSSIEFIFNQQPSIMKVFKTINYEGTNGWEVTKMESDIEGFISGGNRSDTIKTVKSYDEGAYIEAGVTKRAGFYVKENRYCANIVSSSIARPGEIILGSQTSGIKGYFTTVKIETDSTTDIGNAKELFLVGTEFVPSSY